MKKDLHNSVLVKEKPEMTKEEVEEQLRTATTNANLRIDIEMEEELLPLPKGIGDFLKPILLWWWQLLFGQSTSKFALFKVI